MVEPGDVEGLADAMASAYSREWDARAVAGSSKALSARDSALEVAAIYARICGCDEDDAT